MHQRLLRIALLLLLAAPGAASAAPLKLAAPGLQGEGLPQATVDFLSDHLSQQLAHRGVNVLTAVEVRALIGLERQRHLMGCAEQEGCALEVADALGVSGLVGGAIRKTAEGFQVVVEVRATDGKTMARAQRTAADEDGLLPALSSIAEELARTLLAVESGPVTRVGSDVQVVHRERVLPRNVVSVSPLGLAAGFFGLEYERVLLPWLSAFVTPQWIVDYWVPRSAVEVTVGARMYPFGAAPTGLSVGPFLLAGSGRSVLVEPGTQVPVFVVGPSVVAGAQFAWSFGLFDDQLLFTPGIGVGWNFLHGYLATDPLTAGNLVVTYRLSLGWSFGR